MSVLICAGRSAAHTSPLIPAPVHLSGRCFLSVWAKTFYLNLLRVPLKALCYCSEPSCVCVTWESSAAWPSPNTLVHMRAHTHSRFCLAEIEELGKAYLWSLSHRCSDFSNDAHFKRHFYLSASLDAKRRQDAGIFVCACVCAHCIQLVIETCRQYAFHWGMFHIMWACNGNLWLLTQPR